MGLSIIQGCKEKNCSRIFAIDTNSKKEEWAKKFGASASFFGTGIEGQAESS